MTKYGYKFKRHECPDCGGMIAANWWVRHARTHHPALVVALTPEAQEHLDGIGTQAGIEKTVEEALRIYRYLGSFIELMINIGILPKDFGMDQ